MNETMVQRFSWSRCQSDARRFGGRPDQPAARVDGFFNNVLFPNLPVLSFACLSLSVLSPVCWAFSPGHCSLLTDTCSPVTPPPFPQAKGESDLAYESFRVYLELGPQRRYMATARKVGASLSTVKRWACDFDWRARLQSCAAQSMQQYVETKNILHREENLDLLAGRPRLDGIRFENPNGIPFIQPRVASSELPWDTDTKKTSNPTICAKWHLLFAAQLDH